MNINTKIRLTILASALALAAAAPAAFAQGTWYKNIHTDPPTGAADTDNPPARHTKEVMEKTALPSNVAASTGTWYQDIHTDPRTGLESPDNLPASHTRYIMEKKIVPVPAGVWEQESKRYGPNS